MITITSDTDTTQKRGKTRQMQTHSPNNQIQIHKRQPGIKGRVICLSKCTVALHDKITAKQT